MRCAVTFNTEERDKREVHDGELADSQNLLDMDIKRERSSAT